MSQNVSSAAVVIGALRVKQTFNSFLASGDICRVLKTFADYLDRDQDQQNVSPDLIQYCLTLDSIPERFL